jgi:hypothetical protein
MDDATLARGMARLRSELEDGTWDTKYGELRTMTEANLGYHVVVAQ